MGPMYTRKVYSEYNVGSYRSSMTPNLHEIRIIPVLKIGLKLKTCSEKPRVR